MVGSVRSLGIFLKISNLLNPSASFDGIFNDYFIIFIIFLHQLILLMEESKENN